MKGRANALIGGASLIGVCFVAYLDIDRTSPGPLSITHGRVGELASEDGCALCHGGMFESMDSACGVCHEGIGVDIQETAGLHGNLPAGVDAGGCAECHVEHTGSGTPLTTDLSFQWAGIPDRDAYDHAALDFTLMGRHAELGCADCHEHAEVEVLAEGQERFRGLQQSCDTCHEDVHAGAMARTCADCHGQEHPFQEVHAFHHTQGFRAVGAHEGPACATCHEANTPHAVEVLAGAGPFPADRACEDCHESPHSETFVTESGALSGLERAESCEACHDARHAAFEGHTDAMPVDLHVAAGFPLEGPHGGLSCDACHEGPEDSSFAARYPGRRADACVACHEDPHAGQFDHPPYEERGCLACHAEHSFRPSRFDIVAHAETRFPLEGSHTAVACSTCHLASEGEARVFRGTEETCAGCHADAHEGRLLPAPGTAAVGLDCGECHVPERFADVRREDFDHTARTSFALDGAHLALSCEACHAAGGAARGLGFVHERFGVPTDACSTCHADPHDGAFERNGLPETPDGRAGCARCHVTEAFDALVPETFDHARWTAYPLAGEHAALRCDDCHAPLSAPDALGRRSARARGTACSDCHTDPHVGQFQPPAYASCAACHADDLTLTFDHQRDSRFPLDAAHERLDCAACHRPWPLKDGSTAVRYRPLGVTCADCHGPGGGR